MTLQSRLADLITEIGSDIKDLRGAFTALPYASLSMSAATSSSSGLFDIPWAAANQSGGSFWSAGTPARITIPQSGWYLITAEMYFSNVNADLVLAAYGNSSVRYAEVSTLTGTGGNSYQTLAYQGYFAAGTQLQLFGYTGSSGQNVGGTGRAAHLEIACLAAPMSALYGGVKQDLLNASSTTVNFDPDLGPHEIVLEGVHKPGGSTSKNISLRPTGRTTVVGNIRHGGHIDTGTWTAVSDNPLANGSGLYLSNTWSATADTPTAVRVVFHPRPQNGRCLMLGQRFTCNPSVVGDVAIYQIGGAIDGASDHTYATIDFGGGTFTGTIVCRPVEEAGNFQAGGSDVALVTSLPANPVDGQEIYFLADSTNGIIWHLRYRVASSKWEYVGGPQTVRGRVNGSNGAVIQGVGFTCVRNSTGDYTVTFSPAFAVIPIITVTPILASGGVAWKLYATPSASAFSLRIYSTLTGFAVTDADFMFIAMNP